MDIVNLETAIDEVLSDAKILDDIHSLLNQGPGVPQIEIKEGEHFSIPKEVNIDIINKVFLKEYYDIGFGTGYRVQVAIGGVQKQNHGVLYARYCFATLYYTIQCRLITTDFHEEMR